MIEIQPQTAEERLRRAMSESWDILCQRIATDRVVIYKEASLQLQYASLLQSQGEILCIGPTETFSIELESEREGKSIDITCALGGVHGAVELKCFRKRSNRAADIDMYDVLRDLNRLLSFPKFTVRRFICLTDNPYYCNAVHAGHASVVSTKDGRILDAGLSIDPTWAGKWKDKTRDASLQFSKRIRLEWSHYRGWYALSIDL